MTAALGDTTHWVHARGDQQHARHAQEAREGRLRLVFVRFHRSERAYDNLRSDADRRTRSTLDVTYSHKVFIQSSHWLGCFWDIDASRPDAVAAMKKADRKCLTKV